MTDEIKEKIKLETEILRYLFLLALALGSGTLSVILGMPSGFRLALAGTGILVTIEVAYLSWRQYLKINRLIGGAS